MIYFYRTACFSIDSGCKYGLFYVELEARQLCCDLFPTFLFQLDVVIETYSFER